MRIPGAITPAERKVAMAYYQRVEKRAADMSRDEVIRFFQRHCHKMEVSGASVLPSAVIKRAIALLQESE